MALVLTTNLVLLSVWLTLQTGLGHPLADGPDASGAEGAPRVRSKRCSCSNQLDSECHYFCHLDIIWVNTPSKTTVYGLGSAISRRRRRSVGRCTCANHVDHTCNRFCLYSSENPAVVLVKPWQSEKKAEMESSVQPIQRTPHTPRTEGLIQQGPMDEVRSELLALIRELVRLNGVEKEKTSPPGKKTPWSLKAVFR